MTIEHLHYWVPFQPWNPHFDAAAVEAAAGLLVPDHTLVRVCRICGLQRPW